MPRLRAAYSPANPPPTTTTRCGGEGRHVPFRGEPRRTIRGGRYLSRSALARTAWAAASRATGTRNGEHDT